MSPEVETKPAAPAAPSDISKPEKNTAPASVFDQFRAEVYGSVVQDSKIFRNINI